KSGTNLFDRLFGNLNSGFFKCQLYGREGVTAEIFRARGGGSGFPFPKACLSQYLLYLLPLGWAGIDGSRVGLQLISHEHGRAGVGLILDFSLGKRGSIMPAPIHRAQALVDKALFEELVEGCEYNRFVLGSHGRIWLGEPAYDSQALELLTLEIEIFLGVFSAFLAHVDSLHVQLFSTQLLVDFDLD